MMRKVLPPVHPGEILREEYLIPLGMRAGALAKFLRTTPGFWLNMQASYDLKTQATALKAELDAIPEIEFA